MERNDLNMCEAHCSLLDAKAVRDEEKWPPLQPLKVSALVIILSSS